MYEEMLKFFRAFVPNRSNYSAKCRKVLSKMISSSLIDNGSRGFHSTKTKKINNARFSQCSVNDKNNVFGENFGDGMGRENDSQEKTFNLPNIKMILKNVVQFRKQRISSWLIKDNLNNLCLTYASLSDGIKNEFLEELTGISISVQLWLFSEIGKMEGGAGYLVTLKEDLSHLIAKKNDERSGCLKLHELNATLHEVLSIWFSPGFMELERITMNSPREILQKICKYERVHPVRNWTDLKRRLGPYRRCFVFFHRSMPGEPIIILHVALTGEISSRLTDLLSPDIEPPQSTGLCGIQETRGDSEDPSKIRAAVFYSLSLAQEGLNGIGISYYLLCRVGQELQNGFPGITEFSTLSPIHQFKIWFLRKLENMKSGQNDILFPNEIEKLQGYFNHSKYLEQLYETLSSNSWILQENLCDLLREPLMRLCARYLYLEKTPKGYAFDGAANLHLKNGAVMWRINWWANPNARGLNSSFGLMVNYRYYFDEMELHGKEYQEEKKITASEQIIDLVKSAKKLMLTTSVKSKM